MKSVANLNEGGVNIFYNIMYAADDVAQKRIALLLIQVGAPRDLISLQAVGGFCRLRQRTISSFYPIFSPSSFKETKVPSGPAA